MRFYNKKDKTDVYKKPALIHEVGTVKRPLKIDKTKV